MADHLSYKPTDGLSYDPSDPKYWDPAALDAEVDRAFEVCNGCRLCFKYCDAFPNLFELLDERYDGDVRSLTAEDKRSVMDDCFQCKLCEVECPYTPGKRHEFELDFPKLVHRFKAQRKREEGFTRQDRVLGDPDGTAKLARMSLGMANVMNRVGLHRWFLEKLLGIHRDKQLPDFAGTTFEKWAVREGLTDGEPTEAVLFQTCFVQNNEPQIGRDTLQVLEANGIRTKCEKGLKCCGMPHWEAGNLEALRENARANLDRLERHVTAGAKVVAINPTCSMMLRKEYPELLEGADRVRAQALAEQVRDPGELVWSIRKEDRFNTDFQSSPNVPVAYHAPCHLRTQNVGFKGRDLLRKLPGVTPKTVMECCGHDGTYAMKTEGYLVSIRVGKKAFEEMKDADESNDEIWATDCPLAALQFEQHAGVKPMHPMTILAKAYRGDSFHTRLPAAGVDGEEK